MKEGRKGFTLVELLIVIVVIGILAGMMMFSSTEAVSSAKASNIISNMTQLKRAATAWYVDNLDRVVRGKANDNKTNEYYFTIKGSNKVFSEFIQQGGGDEILKYISNGSSIKLLSKKDSNNMKEGDYILVAMNRSRKWYVCYNLGDKSSRLKEKLAGRKSSVGLLGTTKKYITESNANNKIEDVYTNQQFVCMLILDLGDLGNKGE